jgi:hypothetical protein
MAQVVDAGVGKLVNARVCCMLFMSECAAGCYCVSVLQVVNV